MLKRYEIEQLLLPKLERLEEERQVIHQGIKRGSTRMALSLVFFLSSLLGAFLLDYLYLTDERLIAILYVSEALLFFFTIVFFVFHKNEGTKARKNFKQYVKTEVYTEIFQAWNTTAQYTPHQQVPKPAFERAGLFSDFNRYTGDDYCKGTLTDGRQFYFSELNVERVERISKDQTRTVPVFKGLFFVLDQTLPYKGFNGQLTVKPKKQATKKKKKKKPTPKRKATPKYNDQILDADFALSTTPAEKQEEPKEDPFDQIYDLTSTDPLARTKLSDEFCNQVTKLRLHQRNNIALSFKDNKAYLTCKHHLDFWPVHLNLPMLSKARVRHVSWSFSVAFSLLEALAEITYADRPPVR